MSTTTPTYPFTEQDMADAADEWGCNCGPSALAFALQVPLDRVRGAIPDFEAKRYTSPTMMMAALRTLQVPYIERRASVETMHWHTPALVRVQWTGPWTQPGANPKWAYWYTHWIATYMVERQAAMVFDCNGGISGFTAWIREIVPLLTGSIKRADGGWMPTHVWQITEAKR